MRRLLSFVLASLMVLGLLTSALAGEPREKYLTIYTFGPRDQKRVAITIDDWNDPELIPAFLDVAKESGAKLTLYPIGANLHEKHREIWQRVIDEGHEIGNHSTTHKKLGTLPRDSIIRQLTHMDRNLEKALGHPHTVNTLRYPYGDGRHLGTRSAFAKAVSDGGYRHVVLWDIDEKTPEAILRRVENGSIILLHSLKRDLRILKRILPAIKDKGFEMVTVSELLGLTKDGYKEEGQAPAEAADTDAANKPDEGAVTVQPTATPVPALPKEGFTIEADEP